MRKLNPELVKNGSLIKYGKDYRVSVPTGEIDMNMPPKRTKRSEIDGRKAMNLGNDSKVDKELKELILNGHNDR